MSGQNVNGGVESRETGLSSNLGEPAVVRDKVRHFFLQVLAKVLHPVGSLGEAGGSDHVRANLGGILVVLEGQAPVLGEGVLLGLIRNDQLGRSNRRDGADKRNGSGDLADSREELTAGSLLMLWWMDLYNGRTQYACVHMRGMEREGEGEKDENQRHDQNDQYRKFVASV